ncbi:MAG: hypothetical protein L6R45_34050 [Anaerolineae bacterium]|nr:hypothetical protein [Anaerolineae bacterium]
MGTEFGYNQSSPPSDSPGYGLLGCAGGILVGLLGGGLLLVLASLVVAVIAPAPTLAETASVPGLRLTMNEASLNQFAQSTAGAPVQLDLLPGNQVNLTSDTSVTAFGVTLPVQITGRFGLQITPQSTVEVRLIQADVSGVDLPPETTASMFDSQLPALNQSLNQMLVEASTVLGAPLTLTGLGTTDTEFWLEARLVP